MANSLEKHINRYLQENERLSKQKLVGLIKEDFPSWSDNTINMYLSKLKSEGIINAPSRGVYEVDNTSIFQPQVSTTLKRIHNKTKREFPYITFCVWDSIWLNDLMHHQPFKHYIVIEVEKDASESVFGWLSQTIKNVFLNPREEIFNHYIYPLEDAVIIKNLVSESPLMEVQKIVVPTLEKLLVDMLIDKNLFAAQQNEKEFIIQSAMDKFRLNTSKMRRYAARRNREREIEELLNINLAK